MRPLVAHKRARIQVQLDAASSVTACSVVEHKRQSRRLHGGVGCLRCSGSGADIQRRKGRQPSPPHSILLRLLRPTAECAANAAMGLTVWSWTWVYALLCAIRGRVMPPPAETLVIVIPVALTLASSCLSGTDGGRVVSIPCKNRGDHCPSSPVAGITLSARHRLGCCLCGAKAAWADCNRHPWPHDARSTEN